MPTTFRRERANSFIQEELSLLLQNEVEDPTVSLLTITGVDLTPDRRLARVYVTCFSGEDDLVEGLAGLDRAKGFLRHGLSQVLHWRFTPNLEFRADRTWEHGARIDELFRQIESDRPNPTGGDDAAR